MDLYQEKHKEYKEFFLKEKGSFDNLNKSINRYKRELEAFKEIYENRRNSTANFANIELKKLDKKLLNLEFKIKKNKKFIKDAELLINKQGTILETRNSKF
jgi:hypothetical protein